MKNDDVFYCNDAGVITSLIVTMASVISLISCNQVTYVCICSLSYSCVYTYTLCTKECIRMFVLCIYVSTLDAMKIKMLAPVSGRHIAPSLCVRQQHLHREHSGVAAVIDATYRNFMYALIAQVLGSYHSVMINSQTIL